ncbi:mechanosensitive ion channel domain-containing protein [Janthinobacterium sp. 17J80-10]|uniref:mechanosensitive ion channel family protein n=1 Tax=Janthinobacterium sp. 17J80-10 TaxID=2497863 RepID=UPI0010053F92|nr:mechanosensitive ion channel domain-containing protein [Janthinobacterium sp. 17J80-10]QAU35336.1 mechanosensitive ion channel [Janthinobacterium sp. 17J80-10]
MTSTLLSPLWQDVLSDLQHPDVFWQIVTIAVCLALSWGLARLLRPRLSAQDPQQRLRQLGAEGLARALWPLLALMLIWLARWVLGQWQPVNLLRLATALITAFAVIRLALYVLRRVFVRGGRVSATQHMVERAFAILVWAGFALHITGLLPELLNVLEQAVLPIGKSKLSVLAILQAGVFVVITLVAALWIGATLEERLMRIDGMHASMRVVLARLGKSVLIVLAVLFSLSLVGIDLTVLSVFGGALGVGIGLGMQRIVSNYVAGFIILLERSLSIGDVVTVDKYSGTVRRINTRYTTIRAADGADAIIPNEMLLSNPVQNQYLSDRSVRLVARVTVGYESDVDEVLQLLVATTAAVPRVSQEPAPVALLLNLGADGLEMETAFWIDDPENGRGNVLSDVNRAILKALQLRNISIPYPQREVRIINKIET